MVKDAPNTLLVARKGSPLVIGIGNDEMYIGSDAIVLSLWTDKVIYLEEGDIRSHYPYILSIYDQRISLLLVLLKPYSLKPTRLAKGLIITLCRKKSLNNLW